MIRVPYGAREAVTATDYITLFLHTSLNNQMAHLNDTHTHTHTHTRARSLARTHAHTDLLPLGTDCCGCVYKFYTSIDDLSVQDLSSRAT